MAAAAGSRTRAALAAAILCAASNAMAADVTGVYVADGASGETLHLKWADDEVVGRFVMKDRAYLLEGWLDEPGYMGMLFDAAAPDAGLRYFVAALVPEGIKFSIYTASESGEMDLERPDRTWELRRAPGRIPDVPPDLAASLEGEGSAAPGEGMEQGGGMPMPADGTTPPGMAGGAQAARGGPAGANGGAFQGPFHGEDGRGGFTRIEFAQQGDRVQGELTAFGERAPFAGTVKGSTVRGQLSLSGATGTFDATLAGTRLAVTIHVQSETGSGDVPLKFERGESKQMAERDPRLVGAWNKSSSYTSGDFSVATSQSCVIRADGTLTLYDGRMAGGGNAGSFDSGSAGGGVTSRWHTQGNILFLNGQRYARFGFDGSTLGLWFSENGKPEIWSRQ